MSGRDVKNSSSFQWGMDSDTVSQGGDFYDEQGDAEDDGSTNGNDRSSGTSPGGEGEDVGGSSQEVNATPSNDIIPSRGTPEVRDKMIDEATEEIGRNLLRVADLESQEASEVKKLDEALSHRTKKSKIAMMVGAAMAGLGLAGDLSYKPVARFRSFFLGKGGRVSPMSGPRAFFSHEMFRAGVFTLLVSAAVYAATSAARRTALTSTRERFAAKRGELKKALAERANQTETEKDLGSSVD